MDLRNVRRYCVQIFPKIARTSCLCNPWQQGKFGLNIVLPSTKFIQCQTVSRLALRSSRNVDINNLWAVKNNNKNMQYEIYDDTKDVLKAVRKENEERL